MSINLGTEAIQALERLKGNADFAKFRDLFGGFVHAQMHAALDAAPDLIVPATVRARAYRDVYFAMEGAITGTNPAKLGKESVNAGRGIPKPGKGALPLGTFSGAADATGEDLL